MHDDAQWVDIAEAARRLGVSVVTVRRRIKQGTLEGELQQGRRGPEYRVRFPADSSLISLEPILPGGEPIHDDTHDDDQNALEPYQQTIFLIRFIEQQQAEIRETRAELLDEAKAAAGWRTQAAALEERLNDLRAELERERRPWWRRFW